MATVYILYSPSLKRFYTGVTGGDVADRLRKHLARHSGFTAKASDWTVVHTETYPDKATAYKRERAIKAWKSRDMIERLVNHGRPPN